MPQFTKQSTRPLTAESYRRAAQRATAIAELITRYSDPATQRDKQQLTRAIHSLAIHARRLSARHRGVSVAEEVAEENRE